MRGSDQRNGTLFSYVCVEDRVPQSHPLRTILGIVNAALARLDGDFDALYAQEGRPSIAPERLLRAALLQILFSIRSERQLMEQLDYNLLFRWFVGLDIDDNVWVATVFTKNRDRLLNADIARKFMAAILADEAIRPLLSDEHFSVDGTLIEAWASMKSFQPKGADDHASDDDAGGEDGGAANDVRPDDDDHQDGAPVVRDRNADVDFRGQKRSNDTHASTTDAQGERQTRAIVLHGTCHDGKPYRSGR